MGDFCSDYVSEWHPSKDSGGPPDYDFVEDILRQASLQQPQCVDLLELLDQIFENDTEPLDLRSLRLLLLA